MTRRDDPRRRARRGSASRRRTFPSRRACAAPTGCTTISSAFYRDDKAATGWNNLVFPNVAMPHVLWQLSGRQAGRDASSKTTRRRRPRRIAAKGLALARAAARTASDRRQDARRSGLARHDVAGGIPARSSPTSSTFSITWREPAKNKRISIGIVVLIYLGVLFVFAYCAEARILERRSLTAPSDHAARRTSRARAAVASRDVAPSRRIDRRPRAHGPRKETTP